MRKRKIPVYKPATSKCTALFLHIQTYVLQISNRISLISHQTCSFFPESKYCRCVLILYELTYLLIT